MHARSLHWAKRSFVTPVWPLIRPCRSTKRIAKTFQLDVTRLDPAAALTSVKGIDFRLGLVWMPSSQVVLSGNARAAIRQRMLFHCRTREEGLGQAIGKVPLDEVAGSVAHRLVGAGDFRTLELKALKPLAVVASIGDCLNKGGFVWRVTGESLLLRKRDLPHAAALWRCRSVFTSLAALTLLTYQLVTAFTGATGAQEVRRPELHLRAAIQQQEKVAEAKTEVKVQDPAALEFETYKFNLAWTKMKQAEEEKSPELPQLRKEVEDLAKVVESLGGSKPAEMMTLDEAERKVREVREDLDFGKLMSMSNEERWLLAQGLGPAFPISLILSYTIYWTLNIPFISLSNCIGWCGSDGYAYYTTVLTGAATMSLVMAGAYTASIPFKPLIYIGAILLTPWVADNVMPALSRFIKLFRLPDERELNDL
eukprot:symbB.v1.2.015689.t1/scaffold1169.1/size134116/3